MTNLLGIPETRLPSDPAAVSLGEDTDEQQRCAEFLRDSSAEAADRLGLTQP